MVNLSFFFSGLTRKVLLTSPQFEPDVVPIATDQSMQSDNIPNEVADCEIFQQDENFQQDEVDDSFNTLSLKSPISISEREQIYMEMDSLRKERDQLKTEINN